MAPTSVLRRAAAIGVLAGAIGCTQQGRVLVEVRSDLEVPGELTDIVVRVSRDGAEAEEVPFALAPPEGSGRRALPLRLGVEPIDGGGLVRVEAVGLRAAVEVVLARAAVNVRPGPTRVLTLFLDRACAGIVTCAPSETCRDGRCEMVAVVEPEDLPSLDGRDAGLGIGAPCVDDTACASNHCVSGVCCDAACGGGCEVCTLAQGASADGACTPAPRGTIDPTCTGGALCDGALRRCAAACGAGTARLAPLPIDVVLTIDNSGSMLDEIQAVEREINTNFATVLDAAGMDYRVIVVSEHGSAASAQSICISAPLSAATTCSPPPAAPAENPPRFYHYSDQVGSNDVWCTIATSYSASDVLGLHPMGWGALLRTEAFTHFIVVTDDDSGCVHDPLGDLGSGAAVDTAIRSLSSAHFGTTSARRYAVHSIVGVPVNTPSTSGYLPGDPVLWAECTSAVNPGAVHQDLSRLTGGMRYPICSTASYGAFLRDLASRLVRTECRYAVPDAPTDMTPDLRTSVVEWSRSGSLVPLARVAGRDQCASGDYFIDGDQIVLCPTRCSEARADTASTVEVRYLCL